MDGEGMYGGGGNAGDLSGGNVAASIGGSKADASVRPPPVLIVSGGGGAFMHPTHGERNKRKQKRGCCARAAVTGGGLLMLTCVVSVPLSALRLPVPDPEPILFRGNRYVRASSYPPVALSRAYALLNLFGFRKQNWRFDMFGGVLYFLLIVSLMPICDLSKVLHAQNWYECIWQFLCAVFHNHSLILLQGYVSLAMFFATWIACLSFGEVPWPWYKRLTIGSLHTLSHSLSAVAALVLLETAVELGRERRIIGQGEFLYVTFTKSFPAALEIVDKVDEWGSATHSLAFAHCAACLLSAFCF